MPESSTDIAPLSPRLSALPRTEPLAFENRDEREKAARRRVGTKIKGWRLARLLGVGPYTAAYEAFFGDGDDGDHVTLKLLDPTAAKSERARARFLRAAYAANRFRHPRVLPVTLDGVDMEGSPFVVRPWVPSKPLSQILEVGELLEPQVLRIAEQLLDALEIAHAQGIVHGAISPHNVLITSRKSMRLCDFATPPGSFPNGFDEDDPFAEQRIGPFTAPERCSLPPLTASEQTDIYAVAACMYFALAKKPPSGVSPTRDELARGHFIPLRTVSPEVTPAVAAIVDHALQPDRAHRYGSAYAMLGDVRRAMAGRLPKLEEALAPVPSGNYRGTPANGTPSAQLMPSSAREPLVGPVSSSSPSALQKQRRQREWKGNAALILAIAFLVGLATFVMVREKMEDKKGTPDAHTPFSP